MNENQKKGVVFIFIGILSIYLIPKILSITGLYDVIYYMKQYYGFYIIALIFIGIGVKLLIDNEDEEDIVSSKSFDRSQNNRELNKVVNVTLKGGIIGMLADSPHSSLNRRIRRENANGWQVVQVIPSSSGNILLMIFRIILLVITLFFFTTANGYYVIMKRNEGEANKKDDVPKKKPLSNNDKKEKTLKEDNKLNPSKKESTLKEKPSKEDILRNEKVEKLKKHLKDDEVIIEMKKTKKLEVIKKEKYELDVELHLAGKYKLIYKK